MPLLPVTVLWLAKVPLMVGATVLVGAVGTMKIEAFVLAAGPAFKTASATELEFSVSTIVPQLVIERVTVTV